MRNIYLLVIILLFILSRANAQQISLDLIILSDLSTIDFAAFTFEENLKDQPRIMQVVINPPGVEIIVEGVISWMQDQKKGLIEVGRFRTEPFVSRSFFNDEIGTLDIKIQSSSYNSDIVKEILAKGKPSGIIKIEIYLKDKNEKILNHTEKTITFLNPTPPVILSPQENGAYDRGSILVTWTNPPGAVSYRILANYYKTGQSNEEALNAGNPIVNNKDVGNVTNINLKDILDRELVEDTSIVLTVKAVVYLPGGISELPSNPVKFRIVKSLSGEQYKETEEDITAQLINLFNNANNVITDDLIKFLQSGQIKPEDLEMVDENGNKLTYSDFLTLMNYLEQNKDSIISITVKSK